MQTKAVQSSLTCTTEGNALATTNECLEHSLEDEAGAGHLDAVLDVVHLLELALVVVKAPPLGVVHRPHVHDDVARVELGSVARPHDGCTAQSRRRQRRTQHADTRT